MDAAPDEPDAADERREWEATTPTGERYSVIIAPRGTGMREGSGGGTGLTEAAIELLVETVVAVARDNGTWKIGVLKRRGFPQRFVYKRTGLDKETAEAEAERIGDCIRRGDFSWQQAGR